MTSKTPQNQQISNDDLQTQSHFDKREFDVIVKRFHSLRPVVSNTGLERVDRQHFRDMLGKHFYITESLIMDRIFRVFDQDADNFVGFPEFVKGMSIFLKGTPEEHLKFCFKVYDLNSDRFISKEEMFQLLQFCLVRHKGSDEDEDGVKDIVDLVMKKLDEDRDGRVNEQDWTGAVQKDSLLLEAFGQCIPNQRDINEYLETTSDAEAKAQLNEALGLKKAKSVDRSKKTKVGLAM